MSNQEKELQELTLKMKALMGQMGIETVPGGERKPTEAVVAFCAATAAETVAATKATGRFFQASWRLTVAGCKAVGEEMEKIKAEPPKVKSCSKQD